MARGLLIWAKQYANTLPHDEELLMLSIVTGLKRSLICFCFIYRRVCDNQHCIFCRIFYLRSPSCCASCHINRIFGFLPVFGTWMIYGPIAAYMYYAGNVSGAIGVLVFGVAVLNIFIPLVLQPYLGAKKSGVSPLTVLLGFFAALRVSAQRTDSRACASGCHTNCDTGICRIQDKAEANPLARHAA